MSDGVLFFESPGGFREWLSEYHDQKVNFSNSFAEKMTGVPETVEIGERK
ncbi:hypothetical protein [Rhodohalobacter sulfatireducens]|uniref:Uncharacterized protein n=1 Tax=Rhodohalobacter sulfatireducens TaxID=2911366 RepID=A0ABS9KFQ2_9BACT|nr:hypothetical protein [Rhodohalobacter sulfatireducens]MCG2589684.1 hypothetical protein [Rhodohalobacter sulfatireducens]